jgi:hypothetical protein
VPISRKPAAHPARTRLAGGGAAVLGSVLLSLALAAPSFGASVAANQAALQAQILTLKNLPQAWTVTTGSANGAGVAQGCGGKPFGATHRIAEADGSFQDPADLPQLFEQIGVYHSASGVFRRGVTTIDHCHTVTVVVSGTKVKVHVSPLAYKGGRLTDAFSLRFTVQHQKVGIDLIVEQIGNEIAQVSVADVPYPVMSEVTPLVASAMGKIKRSPPAPG